MMVPPAEASRVPLDPHEALTEWMRTYGDDVWTFVYTQVRRRDIADDLVQDIFYRAFTRAAQFRGHSSTKTWLLAIARNIVRDHQRSAFVRRVTLTDDMERHVESLAEADPIETAAVSAEAISEVWQAVIRLKPIYQEVLILRLREDLSFAEISTITGLPEGKLRVRYQRGLKKIRKLLEAEGGKDRGGA